MKYLTILILLMMSLYPFSYAKYNWRNKNKLGAVGMMLLIALQIIMPTLILFLR